MKAMKALLAVLLSIALVAAAAVFGGTILFWIWPTAVAPFIETGAKLPPELTWWVAVCVTWVFGILIKATQTNTNN